MRLKVDEELCVEWRGRWMKAVVTQVDCSLVGVGAVVGGWGSSVVKPLPFPCRCCLWRVECMSGCIGALLGWNQYF